MMLMTIAEFCSWARCSRTTCYKEIKSGRLRARKIGYATRIDTDDAKLWRNRLPFLGDDTTSEQERTKTDHSNPNALETINE
ncbi:helix-turn-helix domain-containing protein [Afipia sp. 1NLS2]|uniref:helix-turn-helix domain-containing protein n=1 Tax=Afipia sp. 1NLS2 TaxID=666684 RepID=UPI0001D9E235|nr:helix-turn-helix domain-containing protein [Afipia sp. 1NLS2]EFI50018.1 hypothetical protein AfiDRAFT_3725 [Afipia sp. 1NLS2]